MKKLIILVSILFLGFYNQRSDEGGLSDGSTFIIKTGLEYEPALKLVGGVMLGPIIYILSEPKDD